MSTVARIGSLFIGGGVGCGNGCFVHWRRWWRWKFLSLDVVVSSSGNVGGSGSGGFILPEVNTTVVTMLCLLAEMVTAKLGAV